MTLAPFNFSDERFADLQMLRYRLNGFEKLTLNQKRLVYFLVKATLYGRDITFDQFGKHNLRIRKTLEVIYSDVSGSRMVSITIMVVRNSSQASVPIT